MVEATSAAITDRRNSVGLIVLDLLKGRVCGE